MYWWWSLFALLLAIVLISLIGRMARNYIGRKLIQGVDLALLRVPVLNKIYGTTKQVNEALTSSNKTSFKQVVLVHFPGQGIYSIGFLTGTPPAEVIELLAGGLTNKFLHAPTQALNQAGDAERAELVALFQRIYQLPDSH